MRAIPTAVGILLAATALLAGVVVAAAPAADPVADTRSPPPARRRRRRSSRPPAPAAPPRGAGETLVAGVPAYIWRDGCAPTSVGMIVGYYDGHGFPDLVAGNAASQSANAAVSQMIASHGSVSDPHHYEDYALPNDSGGAILADKSAAPAGDEHAGDSVADFMHTSWSAEGLAYGWSYTNMAGPAFVAYVQSRLSGVTASYRTLYFGSSLTFTVLQQEIDAGRPLVLCVDSTGDGVIDHAVAGDRLPRDQRLSGIRLLGHLVRDGPLAAVPRDVLELRLGRVRRDLALARFQPVPQPQSFDHAVCQSEPLRQSLTQSDHEPQPVAESFNEPRPLTESVADSGPKGRHRPRHDGER